MQKGIYQYIEWRAAHELHDRGIEYLNNLEDMGSPSLRLSKKQMNPLGQVLAYAFPSRSTVNIQ